MPDEVANSRYGGDVYSTDTNLNKKQRLQDFLNPDPDPEPVPIPLMIPAPTPDDE